MFLPHQDHDAISLHVSACLPMSSESLFFLHASPMNLTEFPLELRNLLWHPSYSEGLSLPSHASSDRIQDHQLEGTSVLLSKKGDCFAFLLPIIYLSSTRVSLTFDVLLSLWTAFMEKEPPMNEILFFLVRHSFLVRPSNLTLIQMACTLCQWFPSTGKQENIAWLNAKHFSVMRLDSLGVSWRREM